MNLLTFPNIYLRAMLSRIRRLSPRLVALGIQTLIIVQGSAALAAMVPVPGPDETTDATWLRSDGSGNWIETRQGLANAPVDGILHVTGAGNIAVKGTPAENTPSAPRATRSKKANGKLPSLDPARGTGREAEKDSQIRYTLTRSLRARNEADARKVLGASGPLALTLLADGSVGAASYPFVMSPMASSPTPVAISLQVPRRLRAVSLVTRGGSVEASDLDGTLQVETLGGPITINRVSRDVTIRTAGGTVNLGRLGGQVHCYSGGGAILADSIHGEASLETGGGDIVVQRVAQMIHAFAAGGGIRIGNAGGGVFASTLGGPIEVGQASGPVTVKNSGGPVKVGGAGSVQCENASGGVKVRNVSGNLNVSTAMGDVFAELLADRPLVDSFISTGDGDITVLIPSKSRVRIEAQSEPRRGRQGIITDIQAVQVRVTGLMSIGVGSLNGGGPMLRIVGRGGTVRLKKQ